MADLQKTISLVLECFVKGLPTPQRGVSQLSLAQAEGKYLDYHAPLYGVARYGEESDASLRARCLAIPTGAHVARAGLERHLSAIAGVRVKISDRQSNTSESEVLLDGSRQLDGTWQLGGQLGGDLEFGRYFVILESSPHCPMALFLYELNRLRPVGTVPRVLTYRRTALPIFKTLMGTKILRFRREVTLPFFGSYRRLDGSWSLNGQYNLDQVVIRRRIITQADPVKKMDFTNRNNSQNLTLL